MVSTPAWTCHCSKAWIEISTIVLRVVPISPLSRTVDKTVGVSHSYAKHWTDPCLAMVRAHRSEEFSYVQNFAQPGRVWRYGTGKDGAQCVSRSSETRWSGLTIRCVYSIQPEFSKFITLIQIMIKKEEFDETRWCNFPGGVRKSCFLIIFAYISGLGHVLWRCQSIQQCFQWQDDVLEIKDISPQMHVIFCF